MVMNFGDIIAIRAFQYQPTLYRIPKGVLLT
jgi:hypothetical protein